MGEGESYLMKVGDVFLFFLIFFWWFEYFGALVFNISALSFRRSDLDSMGPHKKEKKCFEIGGERYSLIRENQNPAVVAWG